MNDKIKENIDLYKQFYINLKFKDEDFKKELNTTISKINLLKLNKFESSYELKSTLLQNIYPNLKTNLSLNFEKFKIRIEKKQVSIIFPEEDPIMPTFRMFPRAFFKPSLFMTDKEEIKFTFEEIKEINDILKLYLIQKFFEIEKPIELNSIEVISFINFPKEIEFNYFNNLFNENINSKKQYEISNMDLDIKEGENMYSLSLEEELKGIFSIMLYKDKSEWTKPILDILDENIIKIKEIIKDMNL